MIKTSGYRISPSEVEEVILTSDEICQTCVIGISHTELGQGILAFVTLNDNTKNSTEVERSVVKHCQRELANYMMQKK